MSKRFLTITTIMFMIGLIAGAYLVLRTTVTSGELTNSTPLSQGKSSDELLDELLKLNLEEKTEQSEYIPPEDKNLTDEFAAAIISETGGLNEDSAEKIAGTDFIANTVLPYLQTNTLNLLPEIPDSVLKIVSDSKINRAAYFKATNKDAVVIFNVVRDFIKINTDDLESSETLDELQNQASQLATAFENLSRAATPKTLVATHKNILLTAYSLQKSLETIIGSDDDPLKLLIVFNDIETLGEFWKNALVEYDRASRIK
ncbi:MAG: hypothetical protein WAP55_00905 [Minisyncoccia bacterium]